jgi:hypothetical membrane protein
VNDKRIRLLGSFGIITPLVGFSTILIAIRSAPWFSWTENALSDLGVSGVTAIIFNFGLMITAACFMAFSIGLYYHTKDSLVGHAGSITLVAASLFLFGIGLFPETIKPYHFFFSVAFFIALPISLLILSSYMAISGNTKLAYSSLAMGIISILVWIPKWDGVAIPETISALSTSLISVAISQQMKK